MKKRLDDYTKKEIAELRDAKLDYKNAYAFMHCGHCLDKFLGSPEHKTISPRDYEQYEVSGCKVEVGKKSIGMVVVWCKRCGRSVWDSRHLRHAY